eukprot:8334078-Karenia_brevis.AAC.1
MAHHSCLWLSGIGQVSVPATRGHGSSFGQVCVSRAHGHYARQGVFGSLQLLLQDISLQNYRAHCKLPADSRRWLAGAA